MTEFLNVDGGRISYDASGAGPLVVLSHGMGDTRIAWRFLAPQLVAAGYRVVTVDLRGLGESSVGFPAYSRTETVKDLLALIRHLGGPAVIVGHSYSGGAATIAAAREPELVTAIVELDAFTRAQKLNIAGMIRNDRHRKGMVLQLSAGMLGSLGLWTPADWDQQIAAVQANLREPGRMKVLVNGPRKLTPYQNPPAARPSSSPAHSIRTGPTPAPRSTASPRSQPRTCATRCTPCAACSTAAPRYKPRTG
jgi:pimeloyl-ACP methyl ester carboxylesterase